MSPCSLEKELQILIERLDFSAAYRENEDMEELRGERDYFRVVPRRRIGASLATANGQPCLGPHMALPRPK